VKPKAEARHVIFHSSTPTRPTCARPIAADDVLLAVELNGEPIQSRNDGGPLRVVIPRLISGRAPSGIKRIEFSEFDKPGFWEVRGYHNYAIPGSNNRYDDEASEGPR